MFGYHKANREKNRAQRQMKDFSHQQKKWEKGEPEREKKSADLQKQQLADKTAQSKIDIDTARQEGQKRAEELFSRDVQGLDPTKRQAMQYEANKGIQRSMQSANRKLLGDQGQHGIVGKGGVGYAQQRDLQKLGTEAQAGVHRDLDKLNSDLKLKKLAAMFNVEQGEVSQQQLNKQMALDELNLADEKKRQRRFEDQFYKNYQQFTRA